MSGDSLISMVCQCECHSEIFIVQCLAGKRAYERAQNVRQSDAICFAGPEW